MTKTFSFADSCCCACCGNLVTINCKPRMAIIVETFLCTYCKSDYFSWEKDRLFGCDVSDWLKEIK